MKKAVMVSLSVIILHRIFKLLHAFSPSLGCMIVNLQRPCFNASSLPVAVLGAGHRGSLCGLCRLLAVHASPLQTAGSEAGSGAVPWGLPTLGPWGLPRPGREPRPLHWRADA